MIGRVVVCLTIVATASAEDHADTGARLYVSVGGGVALIPESMAGDRLLDGRTVEKGAASLAFDTGWNFGGAVGFHLGNSARAEAEFSYTGARTMQVGGRDARHFEVQPSSAVMSFMVNGQFDLETGSPLRPFVGLGIGLALMTHTFGVLKSPSVFYPDPSGAATGRAMAYQARVGLTYELLDGWAIHLGYRLFGTHTTLTYRDPVDREDYDTVVRSLPIRPLVLQRIEAGITWSLPPFQQ